MRIVTKYVCLAFYLDKIDPQILFQNELFPWFPAELPMAWFCHNKQVHVLIRATCFFQEEMAIYCQYLQQNNMTIINTNGKMRIVTKSVVLLFIWTKSTHK